MFRLNRNERSHWSGNGVHVEPESVFMIGRNMHKNLSSIRDEVMAEGEALTNYVRGHIIQRRKWGEFDKERARELWGDAEGIEITNSYCSNPGLMTAVVGDEWWYDLPMVDNPDYTYLCRIIQAVRDGLREYTKSTPAAAA